MSEAGLGSGGGGGGRLRPPLQIFPAFHPSLQLLPFVELFFTLRWLLCLLQLSGFLGPPGSPAPPPVLITRFIPEGFILLRQTTPS